mmetsp:Transcript_15053/g.37490  ORF Transcript_15053/g.37490 Transcript_15053/m.37490 type:complete len:256 (-) Transcript_15053:611-1378(-)
MTNPDGRQPASRRRCDAGLSSSRCAGGTEALGSRGGAEVGHHGRRRILHAGGSRGPSAGPQNRALWPLLRGRCHGAAVYRGGCHPRARRAPLDSNRYVQGFMLRRCAHVRPVRLCGRRRSCRGTTRLRSEDFINVADAANARMTRLAASMMWRRGSLRSRGRFVLRCGTNTTTKKGSIVEMLPRRGPRRRCDSFLRSFARHSFGREPRSTRGLRTVLFHSHPRRPPHGGSTTGTGRKHFLVLRQYVPDAIAEPCP